MLGSWLDNIYGAWFLPERTFRALREQPVLWQAFGVVGLLNVLEAIRRSGASLPSMVLAVLMGSLGWVSLAALLQLLAFCLGRAAPSFSALLCLTGFAGLPWLLLGPAQSLGGVLGSLLGLAALLWFVVWQVRAVAVALDLEWWRLVGLIPLAFLGGILSLSWLTSGVVALASLR
ncbi:YIP1 family protein [Synechococcus sp. R55.6]|uniref:YIP1 family protein n=1 Tax=unclassified Synechococcus TaxID=2626047 RepID=UPI0039C2B94C